MAHYAILNEDNLVIDVIVGRDEDDLIEGITNWEDYYQAKRTSYNTKGGVHLLGGEPFRKNYAGIGFTYDAQRDAFIPPKPYDSWVLNEDSCLWQPPIPMPTNEILKYKWDEESSSWLEL